MIKKPSFRFRQTWRGRYSSRTGRGCPSPTDINQNVGLGETHTAANDFDAVMHDRPIVTASVRQACVHHVPTGFNENRNTSTSFVYLITIIREILCFLPKTMQKVMVVCKNPFFLLLVVWILYRSHDSSNSNLLEPIKQSKLDEKRLFTSGLFHFIEIDFKRGKKVRPVRRPSTLTKTLDGETEFMVSDLE
ncbi:unnamed protein product [Caenorhabditis auriculariae]|uniref:Uncharacterized protein n=1 Tax=Caenorhabditis auriculariae TaxID=2777116 RepID=A0A8S1H5G8_9PELO|nr:unnamed protein product [Caenorhabditis auriculariae]